MFVLNIKLINLNQHIKYIIYNLQDFFKFAAKFVKIQTIKQFE